LVLPIGVRGDAQGDGVAQSMDAQLRRLVDPPAGAFQGFYLEALPNVVQNRQCAFRVLTIEVLAIV